MRSGPQSRSSAFTKLPLDFNQLNLGTLVHDLNEPNVDTWAPPDTIDPSVCAANKIEHKASTHTIGASSGSSIGTRLTKFFSLDHEREKSKGLNIEADGGWEYTLKKPRSVLETLCAYTTARSWIQDAIENPSCDKGGVYLVVGLRTLIDSSLGVEASETSTTAAQAEAPIGQVVGAPAGGDALNVEIDAKHTSSTSLAEHMVLPGERIYEVYYRRLKFSLWRPEDKPKLGKKCWKMVAGNRGNLDEVDDGEDDDILEVGLEDSTKEI